MKERTIFKTYGFYSSNFLEEFKKDIIANFEEMDNKELAEELKLNDDKLLNYLYEDINMFYEDEKINLNQKTDNNIIAIASMGLWNGRKTGYKILGNNLNEILQSFSCEEFKIFYDGYNIKFEGYHHDGNNYILFREIKNSDNIECFTDLIYNNKNYSNNQLNYYTKSLRSYVKNIYGW